MSEKPPRLLRRKADKKPVVAAFVPKGAEVLRSDEIELVPGSGLQPSTQPLRPGGYRGATANATSST